MLFKEGGVGEAGKAATPLGRRRPLTTSSSTPQFGISSPQGSRRLKVTALQRKKKASVPDIQISSTSAEGGPFHDDPHCPKIKERVGIK